MKAFVALSILLLSVTCASTLLQSARGDQVGTVCIAQAGTTDCASTSPVFSGTPGSNLTVAVNIQFSNSTNGFDVSVKTDPSILNPVAIDYSGTVEPQPIFVVLECINGQLIVGNHCQSTDGPGIARLALVSLGTSTVPPTTGHLFTVTFKILQAEATSIGYQTGCTSSSVSGTTTCVSITNGGSGPVPVTVVDPEFVTTAPFLSIPMNQTFHFHGLTIIANGSLTIDTSTKTVNGQVTINAHNDTTGALLFSKTFSFSFVYSNPQRVMFGLAIPTSASRLATTCSLNPAAGSLACSAIKNPDLQNRGTVDIVDAASLAIAFDSVPGALNWNPSADLDGNGAVDIVDAATLAGDYGMPVFV